MLISESTFPHLRAAEEARLAHELERRRVAAERLAERAPTEPRRHRTRRARRTAAEGGWATA
ncbi:hypothetical protein ACFVTX_06140 [Agromyces sp. NPDC058136]|uniref:hypothetical protein n=1 Tax=Agromyces sp. NPDC058136 TaxID=3346354 RepID=UPI0036DB9B9E